MKYKKSEIYIGFTIKDEKRDLTIIDEKIKKIKRKDKKRKNEYITLNQKWYKYHCNKCGNEDWISCNNLLYNDRGCNLCCKFSKRIVVGYNDIPTIAPWMVKYFKNEKDLLDTAPRSDKPKEMICPFCKTEKMFTPNKLFYRHSIGCNCSDNVPYSEKFMFSVLKQLNIEFIWQVTKNDFKWVGNYRYDFYFKYNNEDYIIETHGGQHYKDQKRGRTLEEEQENDRLKYELAINNEIKPENYIVIDCRSVEYDYIKNSILNSNLNKLFNLSKIDWHKVYQYADKNIVKEICDYWHIEKEINGNEITTGTLKDIFSTSYNTIIPALKKGTKYGWCNYNPKEELYKAHVMAAKISGEKYSKPLVAYKDSEIIGYFRNAEECAKKLENIYGFEFKNNSIRRVCTKERKTYKGFVFEYISKEQYEEFIKNKI